MKTYAEAHRSLSANHNAFDILTEESAYWIGFLFADGNISDTQKDRSPALQLCLAEKDEDHIIKFKKFLKSEHKISHGGLNKTARIFKIRSKKLASALETYGITPRKSFTAKIKDPRLLYDRHFWRGMIDGDGWVGWSNGRDGKISNIELAGNFNILSSYRKFIKTLLPECKKKISRNGKSYQLLLTSRKARKIIRVLYRDSPVALSRKLLAAREILAKATPPIII